MSALTTQLKGPQPVSEVALDLLRRGLYIAPVVALLGGIIWGLEGAGSVGYGLGLVLLNFWMSASIIAYTSRISLALLMVGVMGGFIVRLAIIFGAFWIVKDAGWINVVALGLTIIITHLGLLAWETKYISASLAFPGLKPKNQLRKSKLKSSKNNKASKNPKNLKKESETELEEELNV